ncbi:MAG: dCTP deaminase [Anaerolineae bacterium]
MILPGQEILKRGLVSPTLQPGTLNGCSFGLGSAGYDVRVEFDDTGLREWYFLEPGEFLLASTMEQFSMSIDVVGIVHDKSSLARRGVSVQNTVIEPGWCGFLTLEIANHGKDCVGLRRGQGIAQVLFHLLSAPAEMLYNGKYQNQGRGPQEAR